jgi:DNA-binding IclR family transcriptional regulator
MTKEHFWSSVLMPKDVASGVPSAIKSAARALRILEFFAEIRRGARANEIAERLEMPQSSTSVLLASLVKLNYLDFDYATHNFRPTLRVAMLGAWLDTGPFRDGSMLQMLERVADETSSLVSLSQGNDIYVRYLHVIQSHNQALHLSLALRRYIVWSSAGISLLVGRPEVEIKKLVAATRAQDDPLVAQIKFENVLEMVRLADRQGYFFSRGMVTPGMGTISMRLPPALAGTQGPLVFGVGGRLEVLERSEQAIVQQMRDELEKMERDRRSFHQG